MRLINCIHVQYSIDDWSAANHCLLEHHDSGIFSLPTSTLYQSDYASSNDITDNDRSLVSVGHLGMLYKMKLLLHLII